MLYIQYTHSKMHFYEENCNSTVTGRQDYKVDTTNHGFENKLVQEFSVLFKPGSKLTLYAHKYVDTSQLPPCVFVKHLILFLFIKSLLFCYKKTFILLKRHWCWERKPCTQSQHFSSSQRCSGQGSVSGFSIPNLPYHDFIELDLYTALELSCWNKSGSLSSSGGKM